MKTTEYKSLKEVWQMKDNAYKAFVKSGKDYLEYINDATKDFIKKNNIKYGKDKLATNKSN
ncbi:MAG: hypothetical protein ABSG15_14880 [FCB group bacterium]|jgi:hypothetical protein